MVKGWCRPFPIGPRERGTPMGLHPPYFESSGPDHHPLSATSTSPPSPGTSQTGPTRPFLQPTINHARHSHRDAPMSLPVEQFVRARVAKLLATWELGHGVFLPMCVPTEWDNVSLICSSLTHPGPPLRYLRCKIPSDKSCLNPRSTDLPPPAKADTTLSRPVAPGNSGHSPPDTNII